MAGTGFAAAPEGRRPSHGARPTLWIPIPGQDFVKAPADITTTRIDLGPGHRANHPFPAAAGEGTRVPIPWLDHRTRRVSLCQPEPGCVHRLRGRRERGYACPAGSGQTGGRRARKASIPSQASPASMFSAMIRPIPA